MNGRPGLVADIGGTHARFALVEPNGRPAALRVWPTSQFPTLEAAAAEYLAQEARRLGLARLDLRGVAVCAAGPVVRGTIRMTNAPWVVSRAELSAATGTEHVIVVNDFTALAQAIPVLGPDDRQALGGEAAEPDAPIGLIGPGTGLGVSGLIPDRTGDFIALASEGGHVDLAPSSPREFEIVRHLAHRIGHVSAERVLSGPGLELLHATLCELDASAPVPLGAAEIAHRARDSGDPRAQEAVRLFCGWLGAFAGNLALTLGARGGLYIGGGILPKWGPLFDATLFRRRFEAKGRFDAYLRRIPAYLIVAEEPALRGLARLLERPERTAQAPASMGKLGSRDHSDMEPS